VRTGKLGTRAASSGHLNAPPTPLTLADVTHQPTQSADRALMSFFFYAQWGSGPALGDAFDPRIVNAIGSLNLSGAWLANRTMLLSVTPHITGTRVTRAGTVVLVQLLSQTAAPQPESFLFAHRGAAWRLAYDSLTDAFLASFVQSVVQSAKDPTGTAALPAAVAAGQRADREYRRLTLPQPQLINGA